jgi:hypothetical protein
VNINDESGVGEAPNISDYLAPPPRVAMGSQNQIEIMNLKMMAMNLHGLIFVRTSIML